MEEWKEYKLGDVLNFRRGHDLPKTAMKGGDIPVAGSNGIIGYHNEATPVSPCITIGRSGNVGTPFIYDKCWAHNTVLYVDDFKGNNPLYLFYLLKTLPLSSFGGGSAVPTLNRNHIHPLVIKHTSNLKTQQQIASILKSLDNKIEINRRINDNLQQQADALFKSWFVDFEPFKNGEFEKSGLGFIPKGWNVYEFGRVLSPVNEKVGDRVVTEYSVGNTGIRSRSDIYHKAICSNPEKNRIISRGNLVFGMGNDRVTWGIMKDEIGATSPAYPAYKIDESIDYIYFEFFFKHYYAQAKDLIRPSVRQGQTIDKGALMQKKIYVPSKNVWDRFLHIHNPIIETSRCVEIESDRLSELRDVLLPRLMSGEMKVSEMIA